MSSFGIYRSVAFSTVSGTAVAPFASITVRREVDGTLAAIYSDIGGTVPITQPGFIADALGRFEFYAPGIALGYDITVSDGVSPITLNNQPVGTFQYQDNPITSKGDLLVGAAAGSLTRKGVGANGALLTADSTQPEGISWVLVDNPSRPNLLVNPNWQIDQINEGALYTVSAADVRGPDGWSGSAVGGGVFKLRTLADPDNAALKCLEITCTTADAAMAATDDYFIYSAIEGYDAAALMAGTAAALSITAQFKFKSNVNGVYGVSIANSALNRRYIGTFTVADASEHEYTLSLTLDTSGTWLYTNGAGLYMRICLAAGANFQSTAGAWAAGAEQTTSAQANFMSVNTNVAYLKRVQLLPGALVQPYRNADLQKELAKAQRYYAKTFNQGIAPADNAGFLGSISGGLPVAGTGAPVQTWRYPVEMRAVPTVTRYNPGSAGGSGNWRSTTDAASETATTIVTGTAAASFGFGTAAAVNILHLHAAANARLS